MDENKGDNFVYDYYNKNNEQDQILDILPRSMKYLNILKDAKKELGVVTYEEIVEAIRQLKRVAANVTGDTPT